MVAIPGGEPLIHREIGEIVKGLVARKKFVSLCTNALLLEKKLDLFEPSPYLFFSVHLDGCARTTTSRSVRKACSIARFPPSGGAGQGLHGHVNATISTDIRQPTLRPFSTTPRSWASGFRSRPAMPTSARRTRALSQSPQDQGIVSRRVRARQGQG